jgi:hypothetical protein
MSVAAEKTAIRSFTIEIPEAELEDLRTRIASTRWRTRRRSLTTRRANRSH